MIERRHQSEFARQLSNKYSAWERALRELPHDNPEQQLHLGRCFRDFKELFRGTRAWQLFFLKNRELPEGERQLSERSVDAMMASAELVDFFDQLPETRPLSQLTREIMRRGQNYGMLGLAAIVALPKRYWPAALTHLARVGERDRTRSAHLKRDREWRLATLGGDVIEALSALERPNRTSRDMMENPKGYDRMISDKIQEIHMDEKRIATITVRNLLEYLFENRETTLKALEDIKADSRERERAADPELARIKDIMSLPEAERKRAIEDIAEKISIYFNNTRNH